MEGDYLLCVFANGQYIGGGIPVAPLADPGDGKIDVKVVDALPRWKIPFYLPAMLMGKIHEKKITHRYLVENGTLKCANMRLNLDGEIIPMGDCRFVCEKDSLLLHYHPKH